jgi:hypothetical protein
LAVVAGAPFVFRMRMIGFGVATPHTISSSRAAFILMGAARLDAGPGSPQGSLDSRPPWQHIRAGYQINKEDRQ